mgnify:CR=1 FL=1
MKDEYLKKWLIKADEDFKVAEHELERSESEMVTSAVCFHCQQCVEKLLKAYLVFNKIDFGRIHDLKVLLELCRRNDKDFENVDVGNLTFYAVEIRYPDEFYVPNLEEARKCYQIASDIQEFVLKKIE